MTDDEQQRTKRPRKSEREMANRVRAAEIISKGALRLFDIDGRSVEVHVLNAQRTGMLYLVYEGKPYVGTSTQTPQSYTPDGSCTGRVNIGIAELLMDATEEVAYVQDILLGEILTLRMIIRYFRTTDGAERFNEWPMEAFPLPVV